MRFWSQIVGDLATLMDMKKGVVNETVKENRADELSAMFNMMMDQKKIELGETVKRFNGLDECMSTTLSGSSMVTQASRSGGHNSMTGCLKVTHFLLSIVFN